MPPKLSIITVVFNSVASIQSALESVASQSWPEIEHIVVDGQSTDGTLAKIAQSPNPPARLISEPDQGMYDALNKGVRAATGDIIGVLHSDDIFHSPQSLEKVAAAFSDPQVQAVYGDLVYVDQTNTQQVIRYWKSGPFSRDRFRRGWMPPHPTVFVRREVYLDLGPYRLDLGSAADYEWLVRLFYRHQLSVHYIPEILVRMRVGGQSNATWRQRLAANLNDLRAWRENGYRPPLGLRFMKPLRKLPQFFQRPPCQS